MANSAPLKQLNKITATQISSKGVQSLADRPNAQSQYGTGGLSAAQLKLWFDKLASFLAEKVNGIIDTIAASDAADYIRVALDDYEITTLGGLVNALTSGKLAEDVLKLYPSASAPELQTLQAIINTIAAGIATNTEDIDTLESGKLDKVTATSTFKRAYIIKADGTQDVVYISDTAVSGAIPVYVGNGQVNVAAPVNDAHATNKQYVNTQDRLLGATIETAIDTDTYIMTVRLKNSAGSILSTATVDLPLESLIIGGSYDNGVLTLTLKPDADNEPTSVNIDISDLIDGLVSVATHTQDVGRLDGRIDDDVQDLVDFEQEVDLSKIWAHAAYTAEEAETAHDYFKGGKIDKKFKAIEAVGGTTLTMSMDSDYKLTVALINKAGETLSSQMVDLPIEGLITNAAYSSGTLALTFQNGQTLPINISSIISGLVPDTRTVNGHALSANVVITASDVGAYGIGETYTKTQVSALISTAQIALQGNIDAKETVGSAYYADESEKARGYVKGGEIDREIKKIKSRLADLETI